MKKYHFGYSIDIIGTNLTYKLNFPCENYSISHSTNLETQYLRGKIPHSHRKNEKLQNIYTIKFSFAIFR